jgi:hypothetical protein
MNARQQFWFEIAALTRGWENDAVRRSTVRDVLAIDTHELAAGTQDQTHLCFAARSMAMALSTCIPEARADIVDSIKALLRAAKAQPVNDKRRAASFHEPRRYWLEAG